MCLHLPHVQGGFGVPFSRYTVFYTTTSRFVSWMGTFSQERHGLWLSKDDLKDTSSWSCPPLLLLRDIHFNLLTQYDYREVCAPSPSQVGGTSARPSSQNDIPQQEETAQRSRVVLKS
jgi:hypothetical protein